MCIKSLFTNFAILENHQHRNCTNTTKQHRGEPYPAGQQDNGALQLKATHSHHLELQLTTTNDNSHVAPVTK